MKFEVTILGSGGAVPTLTRNPTAQLINCQERYILIDCGEGTQMQIRRFKLKLQKISIILISHLHGDHFFGLVGLISSMHLLGRNKNLTIVGPAGLKQIVLNQLEMGQAKLDFEIDFKELKPDSVETVYEDNVLKIETFPLKHRIPTQGYRIQELTKERNLLPHAAKLPGMKLEFFPRLKAGQDVIAEDGTKFISEELTSAPARPKSYAYCSDTAFWPALIEFIQNVDVLYHEATFTKKNVARAKKTFHSTAEQAAEIAKLAKAKKLLMGHISARYKDSEEHIAEARSIFEKSFFVNDGDVFRI